MYKSVTKAICLFIIFTLIISAACGCNLVDSRTLPRSSEQSYLYYNSSSIISSDVSSAVVSHEPEIEDNTKYGNLVSNLNNRGIAACQGDWIYYTSPSGLYKIKGNEFKTRMQLSDHQNVSYINVYGDWVYYVYFDNIYKVRNDGSDLQKFVKNASSLYIVDDWAYYTDRSNGALRRTPLDNYAQKLIIGGRLHNLYIQQGKIFWGNNIDLNCADLDGSNRTTYEDAGSQGLVIYKNRKYTTGNLDKENIDGSSSQELIEQGVYNITIQDDWIYFTYNQNTDGFFYLYKMKTDGTCLTKLNDVYTDCVSVVGDWIFYRQAVRTSSTASKVLDEYYKIKIDGSENQSVY